MSARDFSNPRSRPILAFAAGTIATLGIAHTSVADAHTTAIPEPGLPLAAMSPPPGRQPLVCRGPFSIEPDGYGITLRAVKNPTPAGRFGENLAPSSCALEDRVLDSSVSASVRLYEAPSNNKGQAIETNWLDNALPFVAQCASTKRCLLWAKAVYTPGKAANYWVLRGYENQLRMTWPDFALMKKTKDKPKPKKGAKTKTKIPKKKSTLPKGASPF